MGVCNEEVSLTNVVVDQPTVADQNELILQLMQQIAEMRVEMQRRQICLRQGLLLTLMMGGLQSTSLLQIWIQLKASHLHVLRIRRL